MFCKVEESGYQQVLPGIKRKTLVHGEKTLLSAFRLAAKSVLPRHAHVYEQTGYLVSGRIVLIIGEERFAAEAGDSWCIPGHREHSAEILEDALVIEIFSPVREDYLPGKRR